MSNERMSECAVHDRRDASSTCSCSEIVSVLRADLRAQTALAELRGKEVAKWADASGVAKGRRDLANKRAAFYKSCALSGVVPSVETIAAMDKEPE